MREIVEKICKIEAEQARRRKTDYLALYNSGEKVHQKQLAFHKCPKRNRWVFGGNRSGKTECGAVETVYMARGVHPYRKNRKNVHGWVVSLSQQVQGQATDGTQNAKGCFNMGLTLFKTAFIIFCVMAFESLIIYFLRGYLGVSVAYPILAFTAGFIQFAVCATLYACGYRPHARRKKHATYVVTAFVVFVIAFIIVTMIAVYLKAQISILSQLLAYVIIPVGLLMNILFFAGLFYLFSNKSNSETR